MKPMDLTTPDQQAAWLVLERLLRIARRDTGQSRRVADFLLAWHNAEENGGWSVDTAIRRGDELSLDENERVGI